ncbi:hypothetical protein BJ741DRAFT_649895 [Chytriomyces cf. hyalinus JEL632]|nr:hypothetical protein BJ741DRAFT_649895 [Chytriomyces cf. hyalinus JEL632]
MIGVIVAEESASEVDTRQKWTPSGVTATGTLSIASSKQCWLAGCAIQDAIVNTGTLFQPQFSEALISHHQFIPNVTACFQMSNHPILDLYLEDSGDSLTKELSALRLTIPLLDDEQPIMAQGKADPSNEASASVSGVSKLPSVAANVLQPGTTASPIPPPRNRSRARVKPLIEAGVRHVDQVVSSPTAAASLELPVEESMSKAQQLDDMFKSSKPTVDLSRCRSLSKARANNESPATEALESNERGRSYSSSSRSKSLGRIKSSTNALTTMFRGKSRTQSKDETPAPPSEQPVLTDSPPETPASPTTPSSPTLAKDTFKSILRKPTKTQSTPKLDDRLDQLQQEKTAQQKQTASDDTPPQEKQPQKDDLDFTGIFKTLTLRRRPTEAGSPEPEGTLARKGASLSSLKAELAALRAGKDLEEAAAAAAEAAHAKKNAWYMNPGKK